ncbi:MAG: Rrf2 family transcriptional regulator [Treponemataceae bacterium]|nr:Rrf2 family transcriptional regulator [Treponemataceae bacterium]MDE6719935.1 Rrf2 family transcriptional regulator [Treponemataceae bacterium]
MEISTRGRYSLCFMIFVAQHSNGNFVSLRDVSESQGISIKYLEQITALLSKAGLLVSARGPAGGYKLSKPVEQYSAAEILRVTEGHLAPEVSEGGAKKKGQISTRRFWEGLGKAIERFLESVSLKDLVEQSAGEENYVYVI